MKTTSTHIEASLIECFSFLLWFDHLVRREGSRSLKVQQPALFLWSGSALGSPRFFKNTILDGFRTSISRMDLMGLEISSTLRVPFLCVSTLFLVNSFYIWAAGVPGLQHSSFSESFGQNKTAPTCLHLAFRLVSSLVWKHWSLVNQL